MNYDKEIVETRLKLFNEIHRAKLAGKTIEKLSDTDSAYHPYKESTENLTLTCIHKFRVHPDIKYRAFRNAEEFAPHKNKWIKYKNANNVMKIVNFDDYGMLICEREHNIAHSYLGAFIDFIFENGTPFGIQE